MSKEIILKIKEVEAEARQIRADADEKAKEKIRNAQALATQRFEKAEDDAMKENALKVRMTREKADELIAHSRKEALDEAQALREASETYMGDAVKLIIGGIFEKCQ